MQPLRSKYAIIIVVFRKNHPPFALSCYITSTPNKHIERTLLSSDYS